MFQNIVRHHRAPGKPMRERLGSFLIGHRWSSFLSGVAWLIPVRYTSMKSLRIPVLWRVTSTDSQPANVCGDQLNKGPPPCLFPPCFSDRPRISLIIANQKIGMQS